MAKWTGRKILLTGITLVLGILRAAGIDLDVTGLLVAVIGLGMFVGVEGLRDIVVALRPPPSTPGVPQLPYTELQTGELQVIASRVAGELARRVRPAPQ